MADMMIDNMAANLKSPDKYNDAIWKKQKKASPLKLGGERVLPPDLEADGSKKDKGKKSKKQEALEVLRGVLTESDSE